MNKKHQKGQAFVEFIIVLPILFFLIIFGLQIFTAIYQSQIKQEEARTNFFNQMQYRANGGFQMPAEVAQTVSQPVKTEGLPIFNEATATEAPISTRVGICRELQGACGTP